MPISKEYRDTQEGPVGSLICRYYWLMSPSKNPSSFNLGPINLNSLLKSGGELSSCADAEKHLALLAKMLSKRLKIAIFYQYLAVFGP